MLYRLATVSIGTVCGIRTHVFFIESEASYPLDEYSMVCKVGLEPTYSSIQGWAITLSRNSQVVYNCGFDPHSVVFQTTAFTRLAYRTFQIDKIYFVIYTFHKRQGSYHASSLCIYPK